MKRFLTSILALLLLATCAWSADIPPVQVMEGGKILPQYLGINATDSLNWNSTTGVLKYSAESGRLRQITVFTTNGTYEKPSWLKFVIVKGVAGGGGGGGAAATSNTQAASASGGSAGGYFEKKIDAADLDANTTVTIGLGGSGATAGANNGLLGGTTSFGAHCTATGGGGGFGRSAVANTAAAFGVPNSGGTATGGDINIDGPTANPGMVVLTASQFSVGSASVLSGTSNGVTNGNGNPGKNYGGGGGGGHNGANQATARAGGDGAPGIVIVEEYE